jgi:hydrogenase nickel incorporation protein HypB
MKIPIVKQVLEANDRIAEENKRLFEGKKLLVINLMSGPGAGKTTLLVKTIQTLKDQYRIGVIEGDIQSTYDAEKIVSAGAPAVQINTGGACHLDANMVREALAHLDIDSLDILIVENVGNLVCPAEFNLGEDYKVALLSVAEGDDKPLKYPLIFHESSLLLVNKTDLLPYVDCSVKKVREESLKINPRLEIFEVSCKTGDGLTRWFEWLRGKVKKKK